MNPSLALLRAAALAFVAVPLGAQAEAKHLLRHTFQPGKSQFYRQTMVSQNKSSIGEQTMERVMTMETVIELRVVAVKDGKAEVQETVRRVVVKATGHGEVDYDSDVEGSDPGPMSGVVGQVGTSTTFQMDERGRISDLKLPVAKVRGGWSATEQLAQDMPEFPDVPVAIGAVWEEIVPMPGLIGQIDGKVTHKLVAVEKGKAKLEQQTVIDTSKNTLPAAKLELTKCGGSMVVDLATGSLVEGRMEMVLKVNGVGAAGKADLEATHQMTVVAIDPPAPKKAKKAEKGVEKPATKEPGDGKK